MALVRIETAVSIQRFFSEEVSKAIHENAEKLRIKLTKGFGE